MDNIINYEQICEKILNDEMETYETKYIDPSERKKIYTIIEQYGLHGKTIELNSSSRLKKIKIMKKTETNINDIQITEDLLQFFCNYAGLPLLTNHDIDNFEKLNTALDNLVKYYPNVKELWNLFFDEVKIAGTSMMRVKAKITKHAIFDYINENDEYKKFNEGEYTDPSDLFVRGTIYDPSNHGKYYVSVDVKCAVYQILKMRCPSIIQNWEDIVSAGTDSKFFLKSKQYRKDIFRGLECTKLLINMPYLLVPVDKLVKSDDELLENMTKILCLPQNDEIIFEVNESFDVTEFTKKVNTINQDLYTVNMFRLDHLNKINDKINSKYYRKTLSDGLEQFKCVPKDELYDLILLLKS